MILDGIWQLICIARNFSNIPITIPGDVHTALLDAKLIPDPYYSTNERLVQWVSEVEWTIQRNFQVTQLSTFSAYVLVLELVDTFATVYMNGNEVLKTTSNFKFYRTDVYNYLQEGTNNITITFQVAKKKASDRFFSALPLSYPYSENNKIPFMNYIRSPQFHSGWDWGPCIIPSGIYKSIELIPISKKGFDIVEVSTDQLFTTDSDDITLSVDVDIQCYEETSDSTEMIIRFDEYKSQMIIPKSSPGKYRFNVKFPTFGKERWNTHDYGKQPLYDLTVQVTDQILKKRIGIRKLVVDTHDDDYGTTFQFVLNDRVITAKGADFIPIDSIPSRMTYEKTYQLIKDMVESNMNIIRIWGGGYYLDYLLDICDELGVLVWQDLMFGCAQYPNTEEFHKEVEEELECQILRMKHHSSLALYCGDNEDFQAINWFSFTSEHKNWLKEEYKKFNQFQRQNVERLDPTRRFWPASPCDGTYSYEGTWQSERKGDMHYWEVWHGGQPFESFYTIKPRFCSEFGYQSYPSLPTVKTFAPENEWNIFSDSFDNHQKNAAGNVLIKNMFNHYFKEPTSFIQQLYLSQVQQSVAIRLGCEYFRTLKPYMRGIIYWQINDCWPVTSWASIEYGGRWKQLQYHSRRFFDPLMPTFYEDKNYSEIINSKNKIKEQTERNKIEIITQRNRNRRQNGKREETHNLYLYVVNDRPNTVQYSLNVKWYDFNGNVLDSWDTKHSSKTDTADIVWQLDSSAFDDKREKGFFRCVLTEDSTGEQKTNFFFPTEYKYSEMKVAKIKAQVTNGPNGGTTIKLTTDLPAFFVHLESEKVRKFSDSSLLLIPGEEVVVTCDETITLDDLTIYQLAEVGK